MNSRNSKKLALISVMFILLFISNSCHEDDPVNLDHDPSLSADTYIKINTSEIGGEDLYLISSRDNDSPLNKDSFYTVTSREGEQLLLVTDNMNELRGLTLSTPSSNGADAFEIDAQSTAISLIFISPGISTVDPDEAKTNIANIKILASYNKFATYLKDNLHDKSLNSLVNNEMYDSLLSDCVEEYYQKYTVAKKGLAISKSEYLNEISFDKLSTSLLQLKNYGYRFVNVVERDIDANMNEIKVTNVVPAMKGAVPLSWGSLFTLSTLDPSVENIDYKPSTNSSMSEIWVAGPGFKHRKSSIQIAPPSIVNIGEPWTETIVYYVIFPFIDLFAGTKSLINTAAPQFKELMLQIKTGKTLFFASQAENVKSAVRELSNFSIAVIGAIAATSSLAVAATVTKILAVSSIMFSGANLVTFTYDMFLLEPYSKFNVLPASGPPMVPTLNSPNNNSSNITIPVVLFWNSSPNAKSYTLQISKYSDFSQLDYNESGITTVGKSIPSLQNGTKYYWRVNAANDNGTSVWSNVWSFTTVVGGNQTGTVTDIDGNNYTTVVIGNQTWLRENLKVIRYNDGTAISNVTSSTSWLGLTTGAYCNYNNDISYVDTYGRLYNWYAVTNSRRLCPTGWHVPSDAEWTQLEIYLGMSQTTANLVNWRGTNEGGKMKESGLTHWNSPNTGATNESGFNGLPGGIRWTSDFSNSVRANGTWWSSTEYNSNEAWYRGLYWDRGTICRSQDPKTYGFAVRCIKD